MDTFPIRQRNQACVDCVCAKTAIKPAWIAYARKPQSSLRGLRTRENRNQACVDCERAKTANKPAWIAWTTEAHRLEPYGGGAFYRDQAKWPRCPEPLLGDRGMKKWLLIVVALAIAGSGAALVLKGYRDGWIRESGGEADLVLSLNGVSATTRPTTLQIRCKGGASEIRLYIPIRIMPPAGRGGGPVTLDVSEEFRDRDRKIVATDADSAAPSSWTVAEAGTYASRTGAAAFIDRLASQNWLYLYSLGMSGNRLASSTIMFPVRGLADHRVAIDSNCVGIVPQSIFWRSGNRFAAENATTSKKIEPIPIQLKHGAL
ncbi:MAG: hypothetical protein HY056_05395 [Proteobacteria bacterium]|nr:hypothetical protein [Pseudomonadota bacterium]